VNQLIATRGGILDSADLTAAFCGSAIIPTAWTPILRLLGRTHLITRRHDRPKTISDISSCEETVRLRRVIVGRTPRRVNHALGSPSGVGDHCLASFRGREAVSGFPGFDAVSAVLAFASPRSTAKQQLLLRFGLENDVSGLTASRS